MKVETHGAEGVGNALTPAEIAAADLVIIASDTALDLSRFENKKVYLTKTKGTIANPEAVINNAFAKAKLFASKTQDARKAKGDDDFLNLGKGRTGKVIPHVLSGVSYLVPVVVLGGLLLAISLGLSRVVYGKNFDFSTDGTNSFLGALYIIGSSAFTIMIPILGGFIAFSIGGKAAIAPAFVVSYIANDPKFFSNKVLSFMTESKVQSTAGLSFIGAILFGFAIGYTVLWIRTWKIPESFRAIMPIVIIPVLCGVIYGLIAIFIIGGLIGAGLAAFKGWITKTWSGSGATSLAIGVGLGFLIGAMTGFDVGGPINKIAFLSCVFLISEKVYTPMGAMGCAIPVPPLGMGMCALLFPRYFDRELRSFSGSALAMGFIGITEGSIPFLIAKPKQVFIANVLGSAVAGMLAGLVGAASTVAQGGIFVALIGGMGHTNNLSNIGFGAWPWIFINVAIMLGGGAITCMLAFLLLWFSDYNKAHPENWLNRHSQAFWNQVINGFKRVGNLFPHKNQPQQARILHGVPPKIRLIQPFRLQTHVAQGFC